MIDINVNGFKITKEDEEKETVLSVLAERQHSEPSDKNKESFFSALKGSQVYVPVNFVLRPEFNAEFQKAQKEKKEFDMKGKMAFTPVLFTNSQTKEKAMPVFTRMQEADETTPDGRKIAYMRVKIEDLLNMADNMPQAFDFIIDVKTHLLHFTLDEMLEGVGGYQNDEEEDDAPQAEIISMFDGKKD